MEELHIDTCAQVHGGFKINIKFVGTLVAAVGATIMGGPVAGGAVLSGAIATYGATELAEMFNDAQFEGHYTFGGPPTVQYYW